MVSSLLHSSTVAFLAASTRAMPHNVTFLAHCQQCLLYTGASYCLFIVDSSTTDHRITGNWRKFCASSWYNRGKVRWHLPSAASQARETLFQQLTYLLPLLKDLRKPSTSVLESVVRDALGLQCLTSDKSRENHRDRLIIGLHCWIFRGIAVRGSFVPLSKSLYVRCVLRRASREITLAMQRSAACHREPKFIQSRQKIPPNGWCVM